jgi:hypothetical protein
MSRRELIEAGLDLNDPKHGRGLCKSCHDSSTGERQPGGWNQAYPDQPTTLIEKSHSELISR